MKFRDIVLEAASSGKVGHGTNDYSYEGKWNHLIEKGFKNTKLLSSFDNMKMYLYNDIYFLTTDDDKYLGYIELRTDGDIPRIVYSDSRLPGGFYNIMFTNMFKHTTMKEILSDISLSDNAIKSYQKLAKNPKYNIRVITKSGEYLDFNKKNLMGNDFNRVSISSRG
jgi:hypothetical protein